MTAERFAGDWDGADWAADRALAARNRYGENEVRGAGLGGFGLPVPGLLVVGNFSAEQEHVDEFICAGGGGVLAVAADGGVLVG